MKKYTLIRLTRKWHRYLGLILGIQFMLWTLGGLYFSWTNIDEIRGDNLKNESPTLPFDEEFVSPSTFMKGHLKDSDSLVSLKIVSILKRPYYEMVFRSEGKNKVKLINALNGQTRMPLSKEEAVLIAEEKLNIKANVLEIDLITETDQHQEQPMAGF